MKTRNTDRSERDRGLHPDESLLAAYAEGKLTPAQRQSMEDHLADCEICLSTITMLARLEDEPPVHDLIGSPRQKTASAVGDRRPARWRSGTWAAAAALFLLLGVGFIWTGQRERGEGRRSPETAPEHSRIFRGPPARTAGPEILAPQPGQVLDADAIQIRWSAVAGATDYTVDLLTADGDPVWQQRVAGTTARIPENVDLEPGETYFVSVRAHLLEARTLDSRHVEFQVGNHP